MEANALTAGRMEWMLSFHVGGETRTYSVVKNGGVLATAVQPIDGERGGGRLGQTRCVRVAGAGEVGRSRAGGETDVLQVSCSRR